MIKKLLVFFIWCEVCTATTYHVATDGSGEYTTISGANAVVVSGDEVTLRRGDTFTETMHTVSGVTYSSYGSGSFPVVGSGLSISNQEHDINISNIEFDGDASNAAVKIQSGYNITIDDCIIDGKSLNYGVYARGTDSPLVWTYNITISNSIAKNGNPGGVLLNWGVRDSSIINCIIFDNENVNLQCGGQLVTPTGAEVRGLLFSGNEIYKSATGIEGITVGFHAYNCIVEKNYVHNMDSVASFGIECDADTHDNIVKNNIISDCLEGIILLANDNGNNYNNKILNNTIVNNGSTYTGGIVTRIATGSASINYGHIIENNVVWSNYRYFQFLSFYKRSNSINM